MTAVFFLLGVFLCIAAAEKNAAIYAQSNNPTGNQIFVYNVNVSTGAVSYMSAVDTQGDGNGSPHSQGSLVTSGNYLLAANGGDDSISLFWIDPMDASNLTFIARQSVVGSFPTTIAATSAWGNVACAVTTFGNLTLTCFHFNQTGIWKNDAWTRDLGIEWTDSGSWPTSQASFSPKNTFLVIQFKGLDDIAALVFPINNNALAMTPTIIAPDAPIGPASYGFVFISDNTIVTTDGANGIVLYKINSTGHFTSGDALTPNGTTAYCWMVYSWLTNRPYAIAAGTANVTEIVVDSSNKLWVGASPWAPTSDKPLTDGTIIAGSGVDWLYVLSKTGISTWPIMGKGSLSYTTVTAYLGGATTVGGLAGIIQGSNALAAAHASFFIILLLAIFNIFATLL